MTATATVDTAWATEFSERWVAAWKSHVPDQVLDLMTDDIVYDDSSSPETMRGKDDVRRFLENTWRAFPDLEFEAVGAPLVADDGPRAGRLVEGHRHQHRLDRPAGRPGDGQAGRVRGRRLPRVPRRQGARLRIVFDMTDLSRQLGLMPEPGKRGREGDGGRGEDAREAPGVAMNHNILCFGKE